ncbi:MAG: glycosyltransferase family 2 protein [Chloroflexi bacterium]|nr:glycosyltransferase family 2 protein [Chloroflexota bacterium]MCY4248160.1 glycosyltransferase family 2 protein [Chloroflexota bacterium]
MTAPRLSVIIPNWNGKHYLGPCLASLRAQTQSNIEIIIVDNASTDGSQRFVKAGYSDLRLIELPQNLGFTGACNRGMRAAAGEFVALLNNDTEADKNWAAEVIKALDEKPAAGIVACKMRMHDQRERLHTAGDFFAIDGSAGNRGFGEVDHGQYDDGDYVFSACGGAAVYRRGLLEEIGFLDDDFFFLLEDVDIAWRAQLAGYAVWFAPGAVVYHHLSATGGGKTASYYDGRNGIWLLVKNMPSALLRKYWRRILTRQARLFWDALTAWRGEAARARLRGMAAGLLGLRGALAKRRDIQSMRRVSDAHIDSLLTRK